MPGLAFGLPWPGEGNGTKAKKHKHSVTFRPPSLVPQSFRAIAPARFARTKQIHAQPLQPFMKTRTQFLTLAALIGLAGSASADLVATDLNTGGTESGFSGGWVGSSNIRISAASDLTYANYLITQTGTPGNVYSANTSSNDRMDSRNLTTAMSGEIWFSLLVNVPALDNFAGISFDSNATTAAPDRYSHALSELRVLLTPSSLIVDMDGGAPPTATGGETGSFAAGTTHLILGRMTVGAGNDTLDVWVDPNLIGATGPGDLPAANFTSTTVDFMDSVGRIGVPISDDSVIDDTAHVDAIRVSDTVTAFEDVTGAGTTDNTDPELAAVDPLSPADDDIDVPVVSDLMVTFTENVAFGTGNINLRTSGGGLVEAFDVASPPAGLSLSGKTVTINPTSDLLPSTGYYVEIDATAIDDLAGNSFAGISGDADWNFTTNSDATPPTASTLNPSNSATDVPVNSSLVLTLSEDAQKGSGNIVIKRTSDDGVVDTIDVTSGSVTISGAEVTIVPTGDLPELTGLYVEIDSGALLDLASNPFAGISGSGTWSFTTAAIPTFLAAADINTDGTDTGFSGGWQAGSNNAYPKVASDLTYANYGITQTGTVEQVYASNSSADRQDYRNLAFPMSGDIWFTVLLHAPAGASYASLTFNYNGQTYDPINTDARIMLTASEVQVGLNGGGASSVAAAAADTTHLVLGQMNVAAGNDTIKIWVDPDLTAVSVPGDLPAADYTETTVDFADSLINIGAGGSKGSATEVFVDAIRLSNTATALVDVIGVGGGGDTTPPAWAATYPQADTLTATGATARAEIDEDGTGYFVVVADGAAAPSAAQVKAGNDAGDSAALASGSIALTASTENTAAISGLTAGTAYDVYFVAEDDEPNLQVTPVKVDITTLTFFAAWGGGAGFDVDTNGDGVNNGLAFLLGASDPNADATGLLPTVSESGGDLVLTFSMLNAANRGSASMATQHSSDLGATDAWDAAGNQETVPEGPGAGIVVGVVSFDVTANGTLNDVVATIPGSEGSAGKLFGRLLGTE